MKVVLDTNVLLSAVFTRGVCESLLDACIESDDCTIVLCDHILREFSRHSQSKFAAPAGQTDEVLAFLRRIGEMVTPAEMPVDACRDPDDLPVLGAAVAGRANVLVTGDAELLKLGHVQDIPILSPRAFYEKRWGRSK